MNLSHRKLINESIQKSDFTKLYSLIEEDSDAVNLVFHLASIMPNHKIELYQILCKPLFVQKSSADDQSKISRFSHKEMAKTNLDADYRKLLYLIRYLYAPPAEYNMFVSDSDVEIFKIDKFLNIRKLDQFTFCDYANQRFTKTILGDNEEIWLDIGMGHVSGSRQFADDGDRLQSPNNLKIYTTFWKLYNQMNKFGSDINLGKRITQKQADVFFKRAEYIALVFFRFNTTKQTTYFVSSDSNDFFDLVRAKPFRLLVLLKIYKICIYLQLASPEKQKEVTELINERNGKWVPSFPHYSIKLPYLDDLVNKITNAIGKSSDFKSFQQMWTLWLDRQIFEMAPPLMQVELEQGSNEFDITPMDLLEEEPMEIENKERGDWQIRRLAALDPRLTNFTGDTSDLELIKENITKIYEPQEE